MAEIFISYSKHDADFVALLREALKAEGLDHWFDGHLRGGESFDEVIRGALDKAKAVLVVWSPASLTSKYVIGEAREGLGRDIAIPLTTGGVVWSATPFDFHVINALDFASWHGQRGDECFKQLLLALERLGVVPRAQGVTVDHSKQPAAELNAAFNTNGTVVSKPGPVATLKAAFKQRHVALSAASASIVALAATAYLWLGVSNHESERSAAQPLGWKAAARNAVDRWEADHANNGVQFWNGNYSITYTDAVAGAAAVSRTYNSLNSDQGLFGWGWGAAYLEAKLELVGDGFLLVTQSGGGKRYRLRPVDGSLRAAAAAADIVAAARRKGEVAATRDAYRERLLTDTEFRHKEWLRLQAQGFLLPPTRPKAGTRYESDLSAGETVTVGVQGYVFADLAAGRRILFDLDGLPSEIIKPGSTLLFTRSTASRATHVRDGMGNKLSLFANERGLVERVEAGGKTASLGYNSRNELISATNTAGHQFRYEYSQDGRHDLTAIIYTDGTSRRIGYHGPEQNHWVKSVQQSDGMTSEFQYGAETIDGPLTKSRIGVKVRHPQGEPRYDGWVELYERKDPSGESILEKTITHINGDRIEREFDPRSKMAAVVRRDGKVARYKYDGQSRPTQRDTEESTVAIDYEDKLARVRRFQHRKYLPAGGEAKTWNFDYDEQGRLVSASGFAAFRFEPAGGSHSRIIVPSVSLEVLIAPQPDASRIDYTISQGGVTQVLSAVVDKEGFVTAVKGAVPREPAEVLGRMAADLVAMQQLLQSLIAELRDPCSCHVPDLKDAFLSKAQMVTLKNLDRALRGPLQAPR